MFIFLAYLVIIPFLCSSLCKKMTKKKLRFGALPTVNMPRKSHDSKLSGWLDFCISYDQSIVRRTSLSLVALRVIVTMSIPCEATFGASWRK